MSQNRKNWSDFEDKAILTLVKRYGTKNWAQISEKMSSKYGVDCRTGKQCRERWHNHLDPSINKQSWSAKQQKLMFEAHQKYGNKWTEIARLFDGRTDNDIKNHFYSMLRRSLRRINKMLGRRNSTQQIKVIKPSVLSKIFVNIGVKNDKKAIQCKKISQALYQFSSSKPDGDLSDSLQLDQRQRLQDLISRLSHYNKQYEELQLNKRESKKSQTSQTDIKNQGVDSPNIHKIKSQGSIKSPKTKQIKHVIRRRSVKKEPEPEGRTRRQSLTRSKVSEADNIQSIFKMVPEVEKNEPEEPPCYLTRLRSKQSVNLGDEFVLPDLVNVPQQLRSCSSQDSLRFKKNGAFSPGFGSYSYGSNNNLFGGPSPKVQFRNWSPLCPSPNISGIFSRGGNYEWKDNNEDLDNMVHQLRRKIQEKETN